MSLSEPLSLIVYLGDELGNYHFGAQHPFGPLRLDAFRRAVGKQGLIQRVTEGGTVRADRQLLERFHTADYIGEVIARSRFGEGYLDCGDTPAVKGIYEAAATVVGTSVDAAHRVMAGDGRAFVPIAGLHHARPDTAAGFCVFNDIGLVIQVLKQDYGLTRIAYADIDAHHGDGVLYPFYDDPAVFIVDLHQEGIYPGTGDAEETGGGAARGTKRNFPLPAGATDRDFMVAWEQAEAFLAACEPEFVILQCGADSLAGDPITSLSLSPACHAHAAGRLAALADRCCDGRLLGLGGGGYNLDNIGAGWSAVVAAML